LRRKLEHLKAIIFAAAFLIVLVAVGVVYWALRSPVAAKAANGPRDSLNTGRDDADKKGPKQKKLTKADYMAIYKGVPRPKWRPELMAKTPDKIAKTIKGEPGRGSVIAVSTGKYRFIGTIGDSVLRCAVFTDAIGNQKPLYPGDELEEIKIIEVRPREVLVEVNGVRKTFILPESTAGSFSKTAAEKAARATASAADTDLSQEVIDEPDVIARKWLRVYVKHLGRIYQQTKHVYHREGGKIVGIRILSFEPGAIFKKRGIKKRDVIYSIAGAPANKLLQVRDALQKIIDTDEVEFIIKIKRGDKKQELFYSLEFN